MLSYLLRSFLIKFIWICSKTTEMLSTESSSNIPGRYELLRVNPVFTLFLMRDNGKICILSHRQNLSIRKKFINFLPESYSFSSLFSKAFTLIYLHQTFNWVLNDLRSHFYLCFSESKILWSLTEVTFQPFFQSKFEEPASYLACSFEGCLALRCKIWFLRHHTDPQSHYVCQIFISFTKKASLRLSYALNTTFKNPDLATHCSGRSFLARIIVVLSLL